MKAARPSLSVDEITAVLATGAASPLRFGATVTQLDHALQTAALLQAERPDDRELAVAGLVHDLGHLLPGVGDDAHAAVAGACVRETLGDRVADLVELHVDAKRYLVATEPEYGNLLAQDSVASMREQGGVLSETEAEAFRVRPLAEDAVLLRRADDSGKVDGLTVRGLAEWAPVLRRVAEEQRETGAATA